MKKIIALLMAMVVSISLVSCSVDSPQDESTTSLSESPSKVESSVNSESSSSKASSSKNKNSSSSNNKNKDKSSSSSSSKSKNKDKITDVSELKNTENFTKNALPHIFEGEINKKGKAVGYHTESIPNTAGSTIEGTKSKENEYGVYTAEVEVDGVKKTSNKGRSSFFPEDMTPQEVVDAINEAYQSRQLDSGNTYVGETKDGMIIQMYLTDKDKIISAFPIY